ncbi:TetR/AcrR family transcriptional regulator [Hymenobacter sp. GOD-10R]|uniref:TetR/AcrR family transcriptional regulator n=1 Tax=Hymenobacter sp. GOD-10R TaxID=3093922 RepID=UPI002D77C301|nr:TetR/AcrR family transcriptional regulator [Hymenobacter sp. GOD-10R]WRQ30277.1 TetR/AcrR family transcriptional regulator [Hymenobacter sp. GOD-10R]
MAKRGAELRQQMLHAAKAIFLEAGFERASMDQIAEHAGTTKRTLYAHFTNKDNLFLAVFDLILALQLNHLKSPADYAQDTEEALVLFCSRFLETILSSKPLRFCRLGITEAERFPQGAVRLHEALFDNAQARIALFLSERLTTAPEASQLLAQELMGQLLYPRFTRALFGVVEPQTVWSDDLGSRPAIDLAPIRQMVSALLALQSTGD